MKQKAVKHKKTTLAASKIIAEIVQSSLGPRGMDKMLG